MRRRALIVLLVAGAALVATASAASAHALVRSSDPANGAILSAPPQQVTVNFTEPPDPKLSYIHVLDQQGKTVESSAALPVPGNGLQWVVPLPKDLPDGVYTVSWRSLSRTDGHVTAGSFSFTHSWFGPWTAGPGNSSRPGTAARGSWPKPPSSRSGTWPWASRPAPRTDWSSPREPRHPVHPGPWDRMGSPS